MSFQEFFARRWRRMLVRHWRGDVVEIARDFQTSTVTARNWLDGATLPRAHQLYRVHGEWPDRAAELYADRRAEDAA